MSNTKMRTCFISIAVLMFFVGCQKHKQRHFNYPVIENIQKTESHFGIEYIDEYHNLENIKDSSVMNWYRAQDKISEDYFLKDEKFKILYQHYDSLENREVDPARKINYSEIGAIFYLSSYEDEESEYLFRKSKYNSKAEKLFDPKTYSDGSYDIEYIKPSYDGNFVALALGKPENFFNHIIVLDCKALNIIGTPIKNAKPQKAGGIIWSPDGKSILFIAYPNNGTAQNDRDSYTAMYSIDKLEQPPKPIFKNGLSGIV
ncbi:MAG: hypothetical protein WBN39_04415, partial [Flavobacteriaceae bacterium]